MLSASAACAEKHPQPAEARAGMVTRDFTPKQTRNWRGAEQKTLHCVIWYPAVETAIETKQFIGPPDAPLFEAGSATPHAPFEPSLGKWPLIVLSHGTGGSAMQLAWLGRRWHVRGLLLSRLTIPGTTPPPTRRSRRRAWRCGGSARPI